jgi:hypothetical protein
MKPSAIRIERLLEKLEATLVPPPRKVLTVKVFEAGEDKDNDLVGAQKRVLAEHIAAHPEDAGRTVKDFRWIVCVIVHPKFIIGADGRVRWPAETIEGKFEDTDLSEGKFEDTDKDTDASETLRTGLDQASPRCRGACARGRRRRGHRPAKSGGARRSKTTDRLPLSVQEQSCSRHRCNDGL